MIVCLSAKTTKIVKLKKRPRLYESRYGQTITIQRIAGEKSLILMRAFQKTSREKSLILMRACFVCLNEAQTQRLYKQSNNNDNTVVTTTAC